MSHELGDIQKRIIALKEMFDTGLIPRTHQHEVHPELDKSERLRYLYFTLPVSINYQRSSPAMWKSALETFNDPETNYVFFPERVINVSREQVIKDLVKHRLALQSNRHTDIWLAISKTLAEHYDSDPRLIIKQGQSCVVRIKNILQVSHKKQFPYLSGQKMANYWLYILHNFTDVSLRNMHKVTIIPDTHVIQSTVRLGILPGVAAPEKVAVAWDEALRGTNILPIDMHPVLWNWSRANFPEIVIS